MADNRPIDKPTIKRLMENSEPAPLLPARTSPVQSQATRLTAGGRALVDSLPQPVKTISRHSFRVCMHAFLIASVVIFVAVAGGYARLMRGPVSFAFLVPSVQDELNAQVKGYRFRVGDAILRLADNWGLEFRLANVSVLDADGREIAKAPLAAVDLSERALLRLSVAPSSIELIGPKLLIVNAGLDKKTPAGQPAPSWQTATATSSRSPAPIVSEPIDDQNAVSAKAIVDLDALNPAATFASLFAALEGRGRSSSSLSRIGVRDAKVYLSGEKGITTIAIPSFHIDVEERAGSSALLGEISLVQDAMPWRVSFRVVNRPQQRRYAVSASVQDIVPRQLWHNYPAIDPLKLIDLPVSASLSMEFSHGGALLAGDGEIKLGNGRFFAPWDPKHPAVIDTGVIRVNYDKTADAMVIAPLEMKWDDSVLTVGGRIARRAPAGGGKPDWDIALNGRGTKLGSKKFGIPPVALDVFRIAAYYGADTDTLDLKEFRIGAGSAEFSIAGQVANIGHGAAIKVSGTATPMPFTFVKVLWPAFAFNGARDWAGGNIPVGQIAGGQFAINLSAATLASLDDGADVPDDAVSMTVKFSGLHIKHIENVPPIKTKDSTARIIGRKFIMSIPSDARIEGPNGKSVNLSDGQMLIADLRPEFPDGEITFKGQSEAGSLLELLDVPALGYVSAVGFKPNLINGQVSGTFKLALPLIAQPKFEQMKLTGKVRLSEIKSNALPSGMTVNGGAVTFDISEAAIGAAGEVRVNSIPVTLAWQRVFALPTEKQPMLRAAAILTDKARDDLQLNVNHIVKGDIPLALGLSPQKDGPPRIVMEANLASADIALNAIGWRKPSGQKASVSFEVNQKADNGLSLDNFKMAGDGLSVNGQITMTDKKKIASFDLPEFSTNQLTHLAISGELVQGNVLKVRAKGSSFDARQLFLALLSSGKTADNAAAQKDDASLDLAVEIDTVFGYYETTLKSVAISAKKRQGKLSFLDISGSLNGERPLAIRIDQKNGQRALISDCTDAGSAFRLIGLYSSMRGGQMNLRVNLDSDGQTDKSGVLNVNNFDVAGDRIVGRVVAQGEQEGARPKPGGKSIAQAASAGEPLHFDRMRVPFAMTNGQLILRDFAINGPALGATMRGRVDFGRETLNLTGTYVPLYGLNSVLGVVPLLGDLLKGREGEGVVGITFAIQGKTSDPDVAVNPLSMVAPGFLRQLFEFQDNSSDEQPEPAKPKGQQQPVTQKRASKKSTTSEN